VVDEIGVGGDCKAWAPETPEDLDCFEAMQKNVSANTD